MSDFTFWDILRNLLTGLQWTLALSLVAFIGGGLVGLLILVMRISKNRLPSNIARTWIELFQGTPLLMQLFLVFFGVALAGIEISPWMAAAIALTLFTSAYLAEIWRGCVEAIPNGQWEASSSLALNPLEQLRYVILPQALRIAVAPTVGFSVQVVKGTAVTSIIGFTELTKTGGMLATPPSNRSWSMASSPSATSCSATPCRSVRATWKGDCMPLLRISALHKYYGDHHVLKGIDLSVEEGQVVAIIGRSGSGKSTLLRTLNGLESINDGVIEVDGEYLDAARADLRSLRQKVGMVFQQFNLFPHLTVGENVMLAPQVVQKVPKAKAAELARKMLERVGLGEKFDAFPDRLSGGQQQRVAIARALAMSPKVLLCDEITSALDPELVNEVLAVVRQLARKA